MQACQLELQHARALHTQMHVLRGPAAQPAGRPWAWATGLALSACSFALLLLRSAPDSTLASSLRVGPLQLGALCWSGCASVHTPVHRVCPPGGCPPGPAPAPLAVRTGGGRWAQRAELQRAAEEAAGGKPPGKGGDGRGGGGRGAGGREEEGGLSVECVDAAGCPNAGGATDAASLDHDWCAKASPAHGGALRVDVCPRFCKACVTNASVDAAAAAAAEAAAAEAARLAAAKAAADAAASAEAANSSANSSGASPENKGSSSSNSSTSPAAPRGVR